jgi:hypothetical protein
MRIKPLLDFIAKPESGGDYNIVWGGIKRHHRPLKPLVRMTIGQVLDWQDSIDPLYMSEAAGRYQIMEDTLRGLYRDAGLTRQDLFDETNQDRLATQLLRRRGLTDYMSGRMTALKFAQSLSKEWASLPATIKDKRGRPAKGQSYYAGDGLNRAHVTIPALLSAVESVREKSVKEVRFENKPQESLISWLLSIIKQLLKIGVKR